MSIAPRALILQQLCVRYLRPVADWDYTDPANPMPVFDPALTSAEQATLADLAAMARFGITTDISLAEFAAIKADLALGRAFLDIATPTQAQAVAAERAIIRVLGALLRS